jgi:hypothetical protein
VAEQILVMENMASSIKTGPDQLRSIHALLLDAVRKLRGRPRAGNAAGA